MSDINFKSDVKIPEELFKEDLVNILTSACYLLIDKSSELNAETTTYQFESVTKNDIAIGDWKIVITKRSHHEE